ncbi:hypothetical protein [Tenacibaculum sp. C7A-26P2]|uniref:hypothetical protein n=1 Tax=Tenacibaculum sp. C7A-26P2 TaxID=3447504 RepID=UPI003F824C03
MKISQFLTFNFYIVFILNCSNIEQNIDLSQLINETSIINEDDTYFKTTTNVYELDQKSIIETTKANSSSKCEILHFKNAENYRSKFLESKNNLILISSIKETVIPGRSNVASYDNYIINFKTLTDASININRIEINTGGNNYKCKYLLKKQNNYYDVKQPSKQGDYILKVSLKKNYIISYGNCNHTKEQFIIFYNDNGTKKHLVISDFIKKIKRMR